MRHLKKGSKLNRTSSHRRAMFRNMAISFIKHAVIKTTLPKAKGLRVFVEPLITMAKVDNVAKRRRAFAILGNDEAVNTLFTKTAKLCSARPGGYLSIMKAGIKTGDKAQMAYVSLVDADESYTAVPKETETKQAG